MNLHNTFNSCKHADYWRLASELLIHIDMKISGVAAKEGFSSVQYMHQVLQRELAQTPCKFRAANRPLVC